MQRRCGERTPIAAMSRMSSWTQYSSQRLLLAGMPWGRYPVSLPFTTLTPASRSHSLDEYTSICSKATFIDIVFNEGDVGSQCNGKELSYKPFHPNLTKPAKRQRQDSNLRSRRNLDSNQTRYHSATLSYLLWRSGLLWFILVETVSLSWHV